MIIISIWIHVQLYFYLLFSSCTTTQQQINNICWSSSSLFVVLITGITPASHRTSTKIKDHTMLLTEIVNSYIPENSSVQEQNRTVLFLSAGVDLSAALLSDQQVVQLSEWELTAQIQSSHVLTPVLCTSIPSLSLLCHSCPFPHHCSKEIQEVGGEGDVLWDARKHAHDGEGEVSTGLLSWGRSTHVESSTLHPRIHLNVSLFPLSLFLHLSEWASEITLWNPKSQLK